MNLRTSRREILLDKTLVMAILNCTPDSFSDGGTLRSVDDALFRAEDAIKQGADLLDIGGESTRPGGERVNVEEEIRRVAPVIDAIAKRFDTPLSIDTSKSAVAEIAVEMGAEIINDVSGLTFDEKIGEVAARNGAGLILMHLRGTFETMHKQVPVPHILSEVSGFFRDRVEKARSLGVAEDRIVLDAGVGFGKSFAQNLELIAEFDILASEFPQFPLLVGISRKSFIGRILDDTPPANRISGSLAAAAIAVWNGAAIARVHDVKETVDALRVVDALKKSRRNNS